MPASKDDALEVFVVYFDPLDYPGRFVVRRWLIEPWTVLPSMNANDFDTLEEARASIPPHLTRIEREPDDDPVVVETWL